MSQQEKKSFFRRHLILSTIGGFFIFIFIISLFASSDTNKNIQDNAKQDAQATTPKTPEVKVSAKEFLSDYTANEVNADNKYKGKLVEFSGQVNSVGVVFDKAYVLIQGGQYDVFMIQCMVSDKNKESLATLTKGQNIVMIGTVTGKSLHITANDCQLSK